MSLDLESAKRALPLVRLMARLGDGDLAKPKSRCPFHEDSNASFSTYQTDDGSIKWKCHAGCGGGDGVDYLEKKFGLSTKDAIAKYCYLAGSNGTHDSKAKSHDSKVHINSFSWAKCVAAVTEDDIASIADWRGYSTDFVRWLKLQSILGSYKQFPAFPLTNSDGTVVGCHYRKGDGTWRYGPDGEKHKTFPLVIGNLSGAKVVHLHEGQWDALAQINFLDMHWDGIAADTAIVATRGAENAKLLAGMIPAEAEVIAWPQNDEPKGDGKETPAAKWLREVEVVLGRAPRVVRIPPVHKDLNDWTRAGAGAATLSEAIEAAKAPVADRMPTKFLFDLKTPEKDDPNELIKYRYLCRGGGMLIVGPTGIGKSTFVMQCMVLWAVGRACFGFDPPRPMKIVLIQAENDEGDLAEQIAGIVKGLGLPVEDLFRARDNLIVLTEDTKSGVEFLSKVVEPVLKQERPDLLVLDPMNSYLGGDINSQKDVGGFLRNGLNPLIHKYACGVVAVHHTNKPMKGKEKAEWAAGDFAYLGAGSAEWANWARAVVAIRSVDSHDVFELMAGKRGSRLGWRAEDDSRLYAKVIKHADTGICWLEGVEADIPAKADVGRKAVDRSADLIEELGDGLTANEWQERCELRGVSRSTFWRTVKQLEREDRVMKSKVNLKWVPVNKRIEDDQG